MAAVEHRLLNRRGWSTSINYQEESYEEPEQPLLHYAYNDQLRTEEPNKRTSVCQPHSKARTVVLTLLSCVLIFVIVGIFFTFFGLRHIIQKQVEQAEIIITSINIAPPFQESGFQARLEGRLITPSSGIPLAAYISAANYSVSLVGVQGVSINEICVGWLELPSLIVAGGGASVLIDTNATLHIVSGSEGWSVLAHALVQNTSVTWRLRAGGDTDTAFDTSDVCRQYETETRRTTNMQVNFLGIQYPVTISTTTSISGFGGLPNISVDSFDIPDESGDGLIIKLNSTLYSNSIVQFSINSSLVFSVAFFYNDTSATGESMVTLAEVHTLSSFTLKHGDNHLRFEGIVRPSNMTAASMFFTNYLKGRTQRVGIFGVGCVDHEVKQCPNWTLQLIRAISSVIAFPGLPDFASITALHVDELTLKFVEKESYLQLHAPYAHTPYSSGLIIAYYHSPFYFPVSVVSVKMWGEMIYNSSVIGGVSSDVLPTTSVGRADKGNISVPFYDLEVWLGPLANFESFVEKLFLDETALIYMQGEATATLKTAMGNVVLGDMPFNNEITLKGLQHFSCPGCVKILNTDLIGGPALHTAALNLSILIYNPSRSNLHMGRLSMHLVYNGTIIGNGTIANASVFIGPNVFTASAFFTVTPENNKTATQFLSTFLRGEPLDVSLVGFEDGIDIVYAKKAFAKLAAPAVVPGFSDKLIQYGQLMMSWKLFQFILPVRLHLWNPFNTTVQILSTAMDITYNDRKIAHLYQQFFTNPIVIPAYQKSITQEMDASVDAVDISFLLTLFGVLPVNVNGTLQVKVGDFFEQVVYYSQSGVPASFESNITLSPHT